LWRPIYGLRQAPREWHDTLRRTLATLGFAPSTADPSLFLRTDTTLPPFYILVYVDDLVFATADTEALAHVKSELQKRHTCTDLGELTSYLGLRITQDRAERTITLTQLHMVQQYVGMGLVLGGRAQVVLTCHKDASWVDDLATQRSSQGYTFSLGSGSVSWRSTRSSSVLSSSCEAEIYAGAMAAQELRWLTYLLTDLGEVPRSPPVLYVDKKAMFVLCHEHRMEHGMKHIALRYFLARDLQQRGQIRLAYVASQANTTDVFTKALQPCDQTAWGKRKIQAPNRLTYDALGKQAKSALAGAALMVGDDEESDYEDCAFAFFSLVEMPGELATLKEALESSDAEEWKKAMESELKSIEENGTWELVELPEGRKAITSKWLFKIKFDADGKIERYKSRLVAKGYQQKKKGFDDGSGRALKLKKALYRLKQAPRQWYLKLRGVLEEIGFTPSTADHSLFMLGEGEQRSFMVVYVDDILIFSPSSDLVKEVMLKLQDKFKCKALGDVSFYLGLHDERNVEKQCMRVHQRKYLEALAANFGKSEGYVDTPFPSGFKCVKGPEEESVGEEERRRFHSLVGSLTYAAVNTRPDGAFSSGQLSRVLQCPNEEKVAAGMRVAKYLGQKLTVGLQYSTAAQRRQKGADCVELDHLFLTAFSDASYASEPEDMTSVGGFI
ncbi:unnamed protein product, partial [Closterium sp. NIES-54]